MSDKRKQSIYFPVEVLDEIKAEADRLDRSFSWVVQAAWKLSKDKVAAIPAAEPHTVGSDD